MKKPVIIFSIMLMSLLLCSCKAVSEVQRRIVVHAIGIDPSEQGYEVSYQVFSGGGEKSGGGPVDASESTVITLLAQGRTLYETEESLRLQTGKEVFLGDTELIVISEELKDADWNSFLQYFRKSDIYLGVNVVYCRGAAKDTIGAKLKQGGATSIILRGVVESAIESGRACSSKIIEISNALTEDNEALAIPVLSIEKGKEDGGGSGENSDDGEGNGEDNTISDLKIGVFSSMLISENGSTVELDENEVMGLRLLKGDTSIISLEVLTDAGVASVDVDEMKIKRRISIENGAPLLKVRISGRYEIKYMPTDGDEEEIKLAAEKQLLALCAAAYSVSLESGEDLFKIEKLLTKYESEFAAEQAGDFHQAIKNTVYEVFAELRKY